MTIPIIVVVLVSIALFISFLVAVRGVLMIIHLRRTAEYARSALQAVAKDAGDGQRMLNRAAIFYRNVHPDHIAAVLKQNLSPSERGSVSLTFNSPAREADRIKIWSERLDDTIATYANWIGQTPGKKTKV